MNNDVVIFCSTLYTDDGNVNPLADMVDGLILCCRIEEMEEGQLKRSLADLGPALPPTDLVCFCGRKEAAEAAGIGEAVRELRDRTEEEPSVAAGGGEPGESTFIEKTEELETTEQEAPRGPNLPRIITIAVGVFIIAFIAWWFTINRSIREQETTQRMTELVQRQQTARSEIEQRGERPAVSDTTPAQAGAVTGVDRQTTSETGPIADREPPGARATHAGGFAVHVASFQEIGRADREIEYLERRGFGARIIETDVKGTHWFRVIVGDFATREEAERARIELLAIKQISYARIIEVNR
jgi:cell division protein FtsN